MKGRVKELRKIMKSHKIDALIVPHEDEHLIEYIPEKKERLKWITGFSGSAGSAIITKNQIYLFVDGRYLLQAKNETNKLSIKIYNIGQMSLLYFIKNKIKNCSSLGIDPKLISYYNYKKLIGQIDNSKLNVILTKYNLIDCVWKRKISENKVNKIFFIPDKVAGLAVEEKIKIVRNYLKKNNCDFVFIQNSDSVAWLLNMRGFDLPYTPLTHCYAIIGKHKVFLFFENDNLLNSSLKKLGKNFHINSISNFRKVINATQKKKKIILDDKLSSLYFYDNIKKKYDVVFKSDFITKTKSIKNKIELTGIKNAHLKDGIALCKFIYWFKNNKGKIKELDVVNKINFLRSRNKGFISLSFPTIAGSGPNGSIIHYLVNKSSNRLIKKNDILLLDSGGQYSSGTTDVTRTITRGKVNKEKKINYTLVLKGHIAVNLAKFPIETKCSYLDLLARQFLWQHNKDFAHSTGHGVGFCLNVHEGPFSISQNSNSDVKNGMVFSNEPGYYLDNKYGIRIENLVTVKFSNKKKKLLEIENLTLAPYEDALIDYNMLSAIEKCWLNNYHKKLLKKMSPFLTQAETKWLSSVCKEIL